MADKEPTEKPISPLDPNRTEQMREMVREDIEAHRKLVEKLRRKMN